MRTFLSRALLLLFFFTSLSCSTEEPISEERGFHKEKLARHNESSTFNYDDDIPQHRNPVLEFFAKIFYHIAQFLNSVLGYVLIIGVIALLVYILVKHSNYSFLNKPKAKGPLLTFDDDAPIDQIDFDALLNKALKDGDFRLAVRYTYLKSLRYLQDAELISWNKDKTNFQYIMELPQEHRADFRGLSSIYEYIWYGQFGATEEIYTTLRYRSDILRQKLT